MQKFPRGKWIIVSVVYLAWQISFSIVVSPLVLGILTAEQMGYTLNTVWLGLIVGSITIALMTLAVKSDKSFRLYGGLSYIKTRADFERFWSATLRGCDDGIIAETHWSGVVLPLYMLGFAAVGIPFPFNVIPAIFARIATHTGVHMLFPREKSGQRIFGSMKFISAGLAAEDTIASAGFLLSGSIIAPAMLHHLGNYIATWTGTKEKIIKHLGLE